jgi:thioredoxin reductase
MRGAVSDVVIIGAGPYGLSVAAHARAAGLEARVFGRPMESWVRHMPSGMFLKSEGWASNLAHPTGELTLGEFCRQRRLPHEHGVPVPLQTFVDYGRWFQAEAVPGVETSDVLAVRRELSRFAVELSTGEQVSAQAVVLAVGGLAFARRPPIMAGLAPGLYSHSADHHDLGGFTDRDVTVVGAGQSALETAALLAEAGATARVVARADRLVWHGVPEPEPRSLSRRLRRPLTELGQGWENWIWTELPGAVRHLPAAQRRHIVATRLGPAGAWWLKDRVLNRVPLLLATQVTDAEESGEGLVLTLTSRNGQRSKVATDHVIAATGYAVDFRRLTLLEPGLREAVRLSRLAPVLGPNFEASVPGLYVVGLASAATFGPAMRFVCGAGFTARQITRNLVDRRRLAAKKSLRGFRSAA